MKKIKLSIAFVFSLLACGQPSSEFNSAAIASESTVAHLSVDGMMCRGCENTLKTELKKLPGVSEVKASHQDKTVDVTFDAQKISQDTIISAIKGLGYTVHD